MSRLSTVSASHNRVATINQAPTTDLPVKACYQARTSRPSLSGLPLEAQHQAPYLALHQAPYLALHQAPHLALHQAPHLALHQLLTIRLGTNHQGYCQAYTTGFS